MDTHTPGGLPRGGRLQRGSPKGPSVGGNSNWLDDCEVDADCGGGFECLWGVCHVRCGSDADCADLGEAHCPSSVESQGTCDGDDEPLVCTPNSSGDGDGDAIALVDGNCAPVGCEDSVVIVPMVPLIAGIAN